MTMPEKVAAFAELEDKCDESEREKWAQYPVDAWKDTPYLFFAETCQAGGGSPNYIPLEYFINTVMTYVGAAVGHRIFPVFNPKLRARFMTFLLSRRGGVGKNTMLSWARDLLQPASLVSKNGLSPYKNIGCFITDFASARGALETFAEHPIVLQAYGELSTLFEKFGITGSGAAFKDLILNLADENEAEWSVAKGFKPKHALPPEVHNTVIGCATVDRWEDFSSQINLETWTQRSNMILTEETRTVFKLGVPDLEPVRAVLIPRLAVLETHKLIWNLSAEAEAIGEAWHRELSASDDEATIESFGRIQVHLFRVIGHLALCLAPLPADAGLVDPEGRCIERYEGQDKEWRVTISADIMRRAIQVAENQMANRTATMPTQGKTLQAQVENLMRKYVDTSGAQVRWPPIKRRLRKFGYPLTRSTLDILVKDKTVKLMVDPEDPTDETYWLLVKRMARVNWHERRRGAAGAKAAKIIGKKELGKPSRSTRVYSATIISHVDKKRKTAKRRKSVRATVL
jgi:hypothetical protein